MMKRRSFLKGLLGIAAIPFVGLPKPHKGLATGVVKGWHHIMCSWDERDAVIWFDDAPMEVAELPSLYQRFINSVKSQLVPVRQLELPNHKIYDGATEFAVGDLMGNTDGKIGTFSCWLRPEKSKWSIKS